MEARNSPANRLPTSGFFASPLLPMAVALALRFFLVWYAETRQHSWFHDVSHAWGEVGTVAVSIATGHGFSSPYGGDTGPSALVPPFYTYLLAAVYELTGVKTFGSHLLIHGLNSLFSAATCIFLYLIGKETLGWMIGLLAAWMWALFPNAVIWSTRLIWETSVSTLLFVLVFWVTLRLTSARLLRSWLAYGLLWGMIALVNPAILSVFPFFLAWVWYQQRQEGRHCGKQILVAILFAAVTVSPWIVRNYKKFGQFIFIRDGLGLELNRGIHFDEAIRSGNMFIDHPDGSEYERDRFLHMGELPYIAQKKEEALKFIATHPVSFARMTLERVVMFWTGAWDYFFIPSAAPVAALRYGMETLLSLLAFVGLGFVYRASRSYALLFACPLVFYPVVYYVTHAEPRYRHPIEPFLVLLSVYAVVAAMQIALGRRRLSFWRGNEQEVTGRI